MAVKRPRPIQSKSSLLMFDSPSEIRSVFKYFRVLVGFGSGSKCGGIPDVKDGCLSPTSPLDFKGFSRFSTGVGLGILVALDDHEPKKAMPAIVSVKLPSWNILGKAEENGGRSCGCKEVGFEDSEAPSALSSDFLDVCYLCRRKLSHHKDIYMYRGDRAFCSEECRNQQIMSDERKERRPSSNSCSSSCSPVFTITPMAAALY